MRSVICILGYPSGQKHLGKRAIIRLKFQGVLAMQNTISIHVGNTSSIVHNNRLTNEHTNQDIDSSRSHENIIIKQENIKDSYEKLFGEAVDSYNAKQRRSDRKINNYLQKVKDSTLDHQKEFIMQVGDFQSLEKIAEEQGCKVWETKEWELRAETLRRAVSEFQENNPNLYVYNAVIHLDESNPHAHVNFIPVGDGMNKGMSRQVSMNRALENMGYDAKFVVSEEAKNVRERGRVKLDNSTNFKNWRDDNLERVKEIAKEVYKEAGYEFEFAEGDKAKEHQSVEAYKKAVEDAKEKSKEIIEEAKLRAEMERMELNAQSYDLWEKDWDKTKKDFPDFEFAEHVQEVQDITGEMNLFDERNLKPNPRDYPRANNISFEKVFALLQEKFNQVREYIALQAHKMASKVSELKNSINVLENKEEGLEVEIGAKYDESEKLNELIKAKMDYTTELASRSELAVMLPDYVKPSKLNKDILLVPRDKWEAKHVSANEISAYRRSMQFITRFEKEIQKTSPNAAKLLEKIEKQRQELSEQRDWSYKYFEKSKAQEKDLKFFRELRDKHTTDEEWDKIISRYDTAKAIEREMPSFDIDQSKGMSGPSL